MSSQNLIKLSDFISSLQDVIQTVKILQFPGLKHKTGLTSDYSKLSNINELRYYKKIAILIDEDRYYNLELLGMSSDSTGETIYEFSNNIFEDYSTMEDLISMGVVLVQSLTHVAFDPDELDFFGTMTISEKKEQKLSDLMRFPIMFPRASAILPKNYNVLRNINDFMNYKNSVIYISVGRIYYPLTLLDSKGVVYKFSDNIITSFPTLKKLVDEGNVFVPEIKRRSPLRYGSPKRGSIGERKSPPRSPRTSRKSPPRSPRTSRKSPPKSPRSRARSPRTSPRRSGAGAGSPKK